MIAIRELLRTQPSSTVYTSKNNVFVWLWFLQVTISKKSICNCVDTKHFHTVILIIF